MEQRGEHYRGVSGRTLGRGDLEKRRLTFSLRLPYLQGSKPMLLNPALPIVTGSPNFFAEMRG